MPIHADRLRLRSITLPVCPCSWAFRAFLTLWVATLLAGVPTLTSADEVETPERIRAGLPSPAGRTHSEGKLDLATLESMALSANPSLARAAALVEAARGRYVQVGLPFNPAVGIDIQQIGSGGRDEQYGIFLEQEIAQPDKLRLNRCVAHHEVRRLEHQLGVQRQRVLTDVGIGYFRALAAQRQLDVTRDLIQISRKALEITQTLLSAKEVAKTDVLRAELELQRTEQLLQNVTNRQTAAWQNLAAVVGQPMLPQQPLAGELSVDETQPDFDTSLARLRMQSPEIAAAQATIDRAQYHLQRQQIEPRPNVTVIGLVNVRDNANGGDPTGGVVMAVPVPIFNRNQGAIHEARLQLLAAVRELDQLELALQQRLAPVFERYRNAQQQWARLRDQILPTSAEVLELARDAYELGEGKYIDLLAIQRDNAQYRIASIRAWEDLRVAEAQIVGLLLSNSLAISP